MKKKKAYVIPHSHWDREWRYPIWETRRLLVDFIDDLIDAMERDPEYKQFIMDGQSVIFEDYLKIRPENEERLKKLIKDGRITAGPWFTLPDLYPLDGECLIRNLMKGYEYSAELGKTMKMAYTSFGWGQTAQFPQIYKSFGMDFCITAKKVSEERAPKSEFIWRSPDGSEILTTRLGIGGRASFALYYIPMMRNGINYDENWHHDWKSMRGSWHRANFEYANSDHFRPTDFSNVYQEGLQERADHCWQNTDESILENDRLFLAGCDFQGAFRDISDIIKIINKNSKDYEFVVSTVDEYIDVLKEGIKDKELVVVDGELRDGSAPQCSGNALAARLYIKQRNKQVQNAIIHTAEPLSVCAYLCGEEYNSEFLKTAWDYLIKAHPHDSINGVTQDKTAQDNMYRLNQAYEIADVVIERATEGIIKHIDLSGYDAEDVLILVENTLPFERDEILKICVDVPREYNAWDINIYDEDGNVVDYQLISSDEVISAVHEPDSRPGPFHIDRYAIYLDCKNIPAMGYRIYKVTKNNGFERTFICGTNYPITSRKMELSRINNEIENKYLKLTVNPNGTVNLYDKQNNRIYNNIHYFEDTGEVGDYWINLRPNNNRVYNTIGLPANIWIENNGELSATIGIETKMELPKDGTRPHSWHHSNSKRSDDTAILTIKSYLTLRRDDDKVYVRVEIDNNVKDHRMRVVYPTGIKCEYSYAAGHFVVDKRKIHGNEEHYVDMRTLPMQTFVDVTDDNVGVGFVNNSLTEYELDENGTLYLTLLKGVKNKICTEARFNNEFPDQLGGQCLGKRIAEYAICPHKGNWQEGKLYNAAQRFNAEPVVMQLSKNNGVENVIPKSTMCITNDNVILSAMKKAEKNDNIIVRIFNPTNTEQKFKFNFAKTPKNVYICNMNEERESAFLGEFSIESNKILTYEFEF